MNILELLDFFEPPVSIGFNVTPQSALEYLKAKGLRVSFSYADISAAEHVNGFTVAKMMDTDMLADVKASLEAALEQGIPFKEWADGITPLLQSKGWWGRQAVVDPLTGQTVVAQLGSPGRLQTIFRTNMQSAYAVGEWEQIKSQEELAPFLMYDAIDDYRTRPEHAALDGKVHPINSEFWKHYHPPNGWNCRCSVIQLSQEELDELGLNQSPPEKVETYEWTNPRTGKVEKVARGTDPGFDFNPGEARLQELQQLAAEKAGALPPDAAKAAIAGLQETQRKAAELTQQTLADVAKGAANLLNASKAAERAAAFQVQKALTEKTPYLAKAIQQLQATKAGKDMTATELLATAKEKAVKAEASAQLSAYKQSVAAGKTPSQKAQAAFDALPEEAQQAITDQLTAQLADLKKQAVAQAELLDIADGKQGVTAKKVLAATDQAGKSPSEVLELVKVEAAKQKAAMASASALSAYKKNLIAGKVPTDLQKAAFDALPAEKQAKFLAEVDKAKAAAAPPPPPSAEPPAAAAKPTQRNTQDTALDPDSLTQSGPQGGSNPGGEFTDTSTGAKWYLKWPDSVEALRNEVLANRLYRLAGVDSPDVRLIQFRGRTTIASRIIEGLRVDRELLTSGRTPGVQENFAIDAWLANWDAVGPDFANTKLNSLGRGIRIDPGGALRFRAQGGLKGEAFGDEVLELQSMRGGSQNPAAAAVFRHVTRSDLIEGTRRILAIPEDRIREMVDELGPLNKVERDKLLATLLARREYLRKQFPEAADDLPAPVATDRVTVAEQKAIEASRANGLTIPTDGDAIEDHHVVLQTLTGADGKPRTRVVLKLRPDAGRKIQGNMGIAGEAQVGADLADFKSEALQFLKGVGALANKGEALRAKDIERFAKVATQLDQLIEKIHSITRYAEDPEQAIKINSKLTSFSVNLSQWIDKAVPGQKALALPKFDADAIPAKIMLKAAEPKKGTLTWQTLRSFEYNLTTIKRGVIKESASTNDVPEVREVRQLQRDGSRVRYIPYGKRNSVTSEGYLQIDLDGTGPAVSARAFEILDEIGVPTGRARETDRLELYLERIAAIRTLRNAKLAEDLVSIRQISDQVSRTEAMLLALNKDAGFDLRTSPNWNPNGELQAFGHGRTVQYRPDIAPAEIAAFERDHVIYHNPTGLSIGGEGVWNRLQQILEAGGQFASQMDRVRRGVGVGGSSVGSDHESGGANYIFTRILKKSKGKAAGVYWKARQVLRLDAFSYRGDSFGRVSRDYQETERGKTLTELAKFSANSGNETNFRDSISLFDQLERIVLNSRADYDAALAWMRENGYLTWPDGRALEDVIDYIGSGKK